MKIKSIEIDTDLGRRVFQMSPPIDVDLAGEMPPPIRSLPELVWNLLCQIAAEGPALNAPKAEA